MLRKVWVLILFSGLMGCATSDDLVEVAETSETHHATLTILSEMVSSIDVIEDLSTSDSFFFKKSNSFLPDDVGIVYIDNTYDDGDGLELELDFGMLGEMPHGILCKDGKYRAGVVKLKLNKPFNEYDAELEIEFDDEEPFYSGDGGHMVKFTGDIELTRAGTSVLSIATEDLVTTKNNISNTIKCELEIKKVQDVGIGLLNDVNELKGWMALHGDGRTVEVNVTSPLKKRYLHDCAKHIVSGTIDVTLSNSASDIVIDFNPYHNEACDNDIAVTVNGKTVIDTY